MPKRAAGQQLEAGVSLIGIAFRRRSLTAASYPGRESSRHLDATPLQLGDEINLAALITMTLRRFTVLSGSVCSPVLSSLANAEAWITGLWQTRMRADAGRLH